MNIIYVFHCAFEDTSTHVATVRVENLTIMEGLEYAFRWTQNIEDSWSMKGQLDGNDAVTVEAPLHQKKDGSPLGLRSTSVGDRMWINGLTYQVEGSGFRLMDSTASLINPIAN